MLWFAFVFLFFARFDRFARSTMVGFDDSRKAGEYATSGVSSNYKNTVIGMKRLIGLAFDDPRARREMRSLAVECVPVPRATGGPPSIGVKVQLSGETKVISMEAVLGMMLQHIGEIAALKAQATEPGLPLSSLMPQDWVIAVPNYYTDSQRRAVLTACDIVGIKGVNRLMHETTATALAYGIFKDLKKDFAETPGMVMFIDMGASAYTVSIAAFEPGKLIVKSAHCDPDLGGRDFDEVIAHWIATQFVAKYKNKLSSSNPMDLPKTRLKLLTAAENAKKTLSPVGVKEARLNLEMLQDDFDFSASLSATEYEALCEPLLARLAGPVEAALKEAGVSASDLTSVEIVGGSTRIGCVKRQLTQILGGDITLSTTMNADEAVARGAALQSAILSPRFKVLPYDIAEAQPYPIQISWADGDHAAGVEVDAASGTTETTKDSVVMFDRGLTFPIVRRVTLRRAGEFTVQALYDESAFAKFDLPVGVAPHIAEFIIKAAPGDDKKVRVNVKEDIHGIIHLSSAQMIEEIEGEEDAADAETPADEEKKKKLKKTNLEFTIRRPLDWTPDEVLKANEAEVAMANNDRIIRETADMRNELESYIYDMRDKVTSDSQLGLYGTDSEKAAFCAKNEAMESWLYEDGFDANKSAFADKLAELKALGNPIEKRQIEAMGRAAAVSALQSTLELYNNWVRDSQANDAYAHIADEERDKVRTLADSTSAWMYEMLDKQGGMAPNQDAALTIAELQSKTQYLNVNCGPIMRKPAPKKAKEEVPKKEEPKVDETKEGAAEVPMDVETEGEGAAPMQMD